MGGAPRESSNKISPVIKAMGCGVLVAAGCVLANPFLVIKNDQGTLAVLLSPIFGVAAYFVWRAVVSLKAK